MVSVLLDVGFCLGKDGQDEGGGFIGVEGGRHNQIFTRLQHHKLHHLTCIHVGFSLGNSSVCPEEIGRELAPV